MPKEKTPTEQAKEMLESIKTGKPQDLPDARHDPLLYGTTTKDHRIVGELTILERGGK